MPIFKTTDGTEIYYKDMGAGQPIVFSHGWPLNADAWDNQMVALGAAGYRVIAHDRRGHGRSEQTWDGNTMDTYADDLAQLIEALQLKDVILVGHSTGGGEVTRYMGRHGTSRVAGAVLIGAVVPGMLKTASNPGGLPMSVFDEIRANTANDRSQFFKDLTLPFYGYNRTGATESEGVRSAFWLQGMMGGLKPELDCIAAFSETDFTDDLTKIDVPLLILHGDDDQIVPFENTGKRTHDMVKGSELRVYGGGAHGITTTEKSKVIADIQSFADKIHSGKIMRKAS